MQKFIQNSLHTYRKSVLRETMLYNYEATDLPSDYF